MLVRPIQAGDAAEWERMRRVLWPSAPAAFDDHGVEIAAFFAGDRRNPAEVLLAVDGSGRPVGFAEVSIRQYAEGCTSDRVAYLEGWYVEEAHRRKGIGAALVKAAAEWGRAQGCTELASDTEIDNAGSTAAHLALGFSEVERIVCFRKSLTSGL